MKELLIIAAILAIAGGAVYAKGKVEKTDKGFSIKNVQTYYQNKASWGEGYSEHIAGTPMVGVAIIAVGDGWLYTTTTDNTGLFKVKVDAGKPFRLKISDGNILVDFDTELAGVAEGTTLNDVI